MHRSEHTSRKNVIREQEALIELSEPSMQSEFADTVALLEVHMHLGLEPVQNHVALILIRLHIPLKQREGLNLLGQNEGNRH